jgi:hypothetical protein
MCSTEFSTSIAAFGNNGIIYDRIGAFSRAMDLLGKMEQAIT